MVRKLFFILTTAILIVAVFTGIVSAFDVRQPTVIKANLENVGAFATATHATGINYAVDNGELFAGRTGEWRKIATPDNLIVGAVAADSSRPSALYIGAANEMAVYRTTDRGQHWMRVPLTDETVGGVTSLAFDSVERVLYVGTDTAGVFRLRDVGSSMIAGGQTELDEPVKQVVTDNTGAGLAFVRTTMDLYRAENGGLSWSKVEDLGSAPTALAVVNGIPATVYVGTADRGVVATRDGVTWELANDGLGMMPGTRLSVDALAVDPAQLDVLYAAISYLSGSTQVHQSPVGVTMSTDGGASWSGLANNTAEVVAELMPVAGSTGAVYALTNNSRTPLALGTAPVIAEITAVAETPVTPAQSVTGLLAWIIAGLAAAAMVFAIVYDAATRSKRPAPAARPQRPQPVTGTVASSR
jgi:photosystem II stability/assembly factor-like uncharacterized protein